MRSSFSFLLIPVVILFTGCLGPQENPDPQFDTFYNADLPEISENIEVNTTEDAAAPQVFSFEGTDKNLQCTVTCELQEESLE